MGSDRLVAIVANANSYVGPALAETLADRGMDLVLGDPPADLVGRIEAAGVGVRAVERTGDLADPDASERLRDAALDAFGRFDSAVFFGGDIVIGRFLKTTADDLARVVRGNLESVYHPLRTFLPPLVEQGSGQILAITSASGLRPTPGAPLYSSTRAAANMLVRNAAAEVAPEGVQVNAVGTNFMDFPGFVKATGADDPDRRAAIEGQVPMGRLGTMAEFAAFCAPFLDGSARFHTGQVVGFDGGWSN